MKLIVGITAPLSVILIKGQLKYFSDLGYTVYLLAPETSDTIKFCKEEDSILLPVDIKREINIIADIKALYIIWRYVRKVKPDIVNIGTPKMGLLGAIAAWLCRVPKVFYTCRGFRFEHESGILKALLKVLDKFAISKAHKVICISDSIYKLGLEEKVFTADKGLVLGKGSSNGIDLSFYNPQSYSQERLEEMKKKLNIQDKFVYGFVGRIIDRKGINELYNTFCKIRAHDPTIHLIIVGKANLEQVEDSSLMNKLENDKDVTLTGYIYNVNDYMAIMDVFVLPAWWEGFGNALIQAAAMGLPIISCDVTGCRDAVKKNYNGILIPPKDEASLYQAMNMLKEDNLERKRLGENGRKWAKGFDSETIWKGLRDLYEKHKSS